MNRAQFWDDSCSGPSFIPGAALGLRTFMLHDDGALRGVTYQAPWKPGENVAECYVTVKRGPAVPYSKNQLAEKYVVVQGGIGFPHDPDAPLETLHGWDRIPCSGLENSCACGFYAYHDGAQHRYKGSVYYVAGLIEGYGRVILGSQGFRASKARIVALTSPMAAYREQVQVTQEALDKLNQGVIGMSGNDHASALVSEQLRRATDVQIKRAKARMSWLEGLDVKRFQHRIVNMRDRYPGVPIYETPEQMLAAHPLEDLSYLLPQEPEDTPSGE